MCYTPLESSEKIEPRFGGILNLLKKNSEQAQNLQILNFVVLASALDLNFTSEGSSSWLSVG